MGDLFKPDIPAPPPPPPPTPMIDEQAIKTARKREILRQKSTREGRMSTILSDASARQGVGE